ncbi:MAG: hypothetical protein MUF52_04120 [Syntrophobacteraceae bacterium]|jgi:hypothetical protein|nr:hypothetical protein [Syntrophobacteraceae bacterium]
MVKRLEFSIRWLERLDAVLDRLFSPILDAACSSLVGLWDRELGALELCPARERIRRSSRG